MHKSTHQNQRKNCTKNRCENSSLWKMKAKKHKQRFAPNLCKPLPQNFCVFQYSLTGKDESGFSSWKTAPAVPVRLWVSGKTVPTVPVSGSGTLQKNHEGFKNTMSQQKSKDRLKNVEKSFWGALPDSFGTFASFDCFMCTLHCFAMFASLHCTTLEARTVD